MIDPDWAKLSWDILQTVLLTGVGLHQWVIARDRVRREQLSRLEETMDERVEDHANRLTGMEQALRHVPTLNYCQGYHQRITRVETALEAVPNKHDLERLHERIDSVAQSISRVGGELTSLARLIGTIDQYLRDHPHRGTA